MKPFTKRLLMTVIPRQLQERVDALCSRDAGARAVINDLIRHFSSNDATEKVSQIDIGTDVKVFHGMSMTLPERRKVELSIGEKGFSALAQNVPILEDPWKEYNVLLLLALPKKPKQSWNLVLTNLAGAGPWAVISVGDASADKSLDSAQPTESLRDALMRTLSPHVRYAVDKPVDSMTAYIGAKEGILYLMDDLIFFGFKKPLVLIWLAEIESLSFTVVTSRTFNIVIQTVEEAEYEFAMISHEKFDSLHKYIEAKGLSDRSLAEERKAKRAKTTNEEQSVLEEAAAEMDSEEEEAGPNFEIDTSDSEQDDSDPEQQGDDGEDGDVLSSPVDHYEETEN